MQVIYLGCHFKNSIIRDSEVYNSLDQFVASGSAYRGKYILHLAETIPEDSDISDAIFIAGKFQRVTFTGCRLPWTKEELDKTGACFIE